MTKTARNGLIGAVAAVLLLVKYVSEIEMRRLDKEVDRLCAIDGGMRIFETAKLPASMFAEDGRLSVPLRAEDDTRFGYFRRGDQKALAGPGQAPGARLLRSQIQIVRTEDGRVMGEVVIYTRGGGYWLEGVPGIGHGKNCPEPLPLNLEERVFMKE